MKRPALPATRVTQGRAALTPADRSETTPPGDGPPPALTFYGRVLLLRHLRPTSWQRALFLEGAAALGALLVLADLASAWLVVVLPLTVAAVVKVHDLLAGLLAPPRR